MLVGFASCACAKVSRCPFPAWVGGSFGWRHGGEETAPWNAQGPRMVVLNFCSLNRRRINSSLGGRTSVIAWPPPQRSEEGPSESRNSGSAQESGTRSRPQGATGGTTDLAQKLSLLQGFENARRGHGEFEEPRPHGVEDRVGDDRAHADDRRLAAALGLQVRVGDQDGLDGRQPGEPGQGVGVEVLVQDPNLMTVMVLMRPAIQANCSIT